MKCPKCGEPGAFAGERFAAGEPVHEYAHVIEIYLDSKNNPQPQYSGVCQFWPQLEAESRSKRKA